MTYLSPWMRIYVIVNQANMRHPTHLARVNSLTASPAISAARVKTISGVAHAAGHPLPNLAATQTAALIPLPSDVIDLIRRLTDPDPCYHDHHGTCQAHGQGSDDTCAHAQARQLLTAWDDIDPADRQDTP